MNWFDVLFQVVIWTVAVVTTVYIAVEAVKMFRRNR